MFGRGRKPGAAKIVARKNVGPATTEHIAATYEYVADIKPDSDEKPFRTTFKEHFSGQFRDAGIRRPAVGEDAPITYDPKSHKVEFDRRALRAERNAAKHASDAAFDSLASNPPNDDR